jgi:hypothetical protein
LSDREFLKQIAAVISRDEKGPILKLVNQLADQGILNCAEQAKVITASDHRDLGSRLYDFRNSIVHAKYDQRSSMHSQSILSGETDAKKWQEPMRRLAWKAINTHGRKLA